MTCVLGVSMESFLGFDCHYDRSWVYMCRSWFSWCIERGTVVGILTCVLCLWIVVRDTGTWRVFKNQKWLIEGV